MYHKIYTVCNLCFAHEFEVKHQILGNAMYQNKTVFVESMTCKIVTLLVNSSPLVIPAVFISGQMHLDQFNSEIRVKSVNGEETLTRTDC